MKKQNLIPAIVVAMFFATGLIYSQSLRNLPIYRYFDCAPPDSANPLDSTSITYGGWSIQKVTGYWGWYISHYYGKYYAECNGYSSTEQVEQEQWFISPGFSTVTYPNATLSFSSCDKFPGTALQVLVSTDYNGSGLPANATWTDITNSLTLAAPNASGPRVWTKSGNVSLSAYSGNNVYVAFKYTCTPSEATDWEIDEISIVNTVTGVNDIKATDETISIYPNPADNNGFYISSTAGVIENLKIYNDLGIPVKEFSNINNHKFFINASDLTEGLYFVECVQSGKQHISKVIIR